MTRYSVRALQPEDGESFLLLHRRAFGPRWSNDHWNWRFVDTPLGRTSHFGAFDEGGRCVASFGGVALRFVFDGQPAIAVHHGDVAVDPSLREGLGGSRTLVELMGSYYSYCGEIAELSWGFPEPGLRRVAVRHARVEVLRDVLFCVRDLRTTAEPMGDPSLQVRRIERCGDSVDDLWLRCAPELTTSIVRDARFLNWRFREHPSVDYGMFEVFDSRSTRGFIALRSGGWHEDALSIMEWLVPRGDLEAERTLLQLACREARTRGLTFALAWFTAHEPRFHRFQVDHGFFVQPTPYQEVFRCWRGGYARNWLHEHLHQTLADFDFF